MQIHLSRPDITAAEINAVNEVIHSPILALGPKLAEFERAIAAYVGRRYAVGVNSGTSGLHLLIRAYGIGEGDEVITTPFSFIASSNCILYERAKPVFVDVEPETGNIDPERIEAAITPRTKAILPVDAFGHPAALDRIRAIARRHGLIVIEDACEAIGSELGGRKTGSGAFAEGAVFAFYPNKQITTGEGGVIVTDDADIARLCLSLRNQGRREFLPGEERGDSLDNLWLAHERLGFNYRLDELSAALGLAQLGRIEEILSQRAAVAALYAEKLQGIPGVRLPRVRPEVTRMSWFVYVIRVGEDLPAQRQRALQRHVMASLRARGIGCRPYFTPIHLQPFYREQFGYQEGDFPVTEALGRTSIALPFHNRLTEAEIDYVAAHLARAVQDFA